jgi:hypothetical protein
MAGKARQEECEGECSGIGTARKVVKGKCPKKCDKDILDELRKAAQKKAKDEADNECKEKKKKGCECDGKYEELEASCENQKLDDCGDICIYYVAIQYEGKCKPTK